MYIDGYCQTGVGHDADTAYVSPEKGSVTVFDFDGTFNPTGINKVENGSLAFNVNGRTVSVSGCKVRNLQAFDLQGRLVGSSSRPTLVVSKGAGEVAILCVTTQDGRKQTYKVKF